MRPVIALLSDFGLRDHYVGAMKGVILGICPDVTIVDITHGIAPHDVLGGALQLAGAYRYFPAGTIFVAIVDPGVGSARRGLAAEVGDYRFVAPDNGVLTAVFRESAPKRVVELTERRYARPTVSRTFEGRDRFAPAAAWLAKGIQLPALGRAVPQFQTLDMPQAREQDDRLVGTVLTVDHFGNLVTNIDRRTFDRFVHAQGDTASQTGGSELSVGGVPIRRIVATYADIHGGEACALFGSTDHLEIALNAGSAAETLNLGRGAEVVVRRHV
jgi:S-adenosylmethionine hydrolase